MVRCSRISSSPNLVHSLNDGRASGNNGAKPIQILFAGAESSNIMPRVNDVTRLLEAIDHGDPKAAAELPPLVYHELRHMAAARMARESPGQTLQATALVHEAWLRLGADAQPAWQNRAHFFGAAAEAMRRILVERARRRLAAKRGSGMEPLKADAYCQGWRFHSKAMLGPGTPYTGDLWDEACSAELLRREAAGLLGDAVPSNP